MLVNAEVSSQVSRLPRLQLQYLYMQSEDAVQKDSLRLAMANEYLNSGNYESAMNLVELKPGDSSNYNYRNFVQGKSEFLADRYDSSLLFLGRIQPDRLPEATRPEITLLKALCYNHLLKIDSTYVLLAGYMLQKHKDTTGLYNDLKKNAPLKTYDLKKARKRSFIPGAGLYYVDEKKHAFYSAFLNLAFLGYTAYSIYTKYYITAALTGAGQFMRFYNGGTRSAVKTGYKKNREAFIRYVLYLDRYSEKKILGL
jgi:hypothetical protein